MRNLKKGFTLIELLVVVAIIGILASVVLASLNSARSKGKDASVQTSMSSMRAQAELGVSSSGTYAVDLCNAAATVSGSLLTLKNAVNAITANDVVCGQNTAVGVAPAAWAAAVQLPSSEGGTLSFFCTDSTGFGGIVGATATITGGASSPDVTCN